MFQIPSKKIAFCGEGGKAETDRTKLDYHQLAMNGMIGVTRPQSAQFHIATDKTTESCYNLRKKGTFMSNTNKTIQLLNLEDDFLFAKVMSAKEAESAEKKETKRKKKK